MPAPPCSAGILRELLGLVHKLVSSKQQPNLYSIDELSGILGPILFRPEMEPLTEDDMLGDAHLHVAVRYSIYAL